MRGKSFYAVTGALYLRVIPAHAGVNTHRLYALFIDKVDPRSCGENQRYPDIFLRYQG